MANYLPLFLEWLPKQTWFDKIEIVLDHNEPTPEEVKLVKDFQKKHLGRIKHIIVDKVDPIGTSMNRCIRESSAELLTIWNVDDLRTDDSIEQQATALLNSPDVGVVYGNYRIVRKFGSTEGKLIDHSIYSPAELTRSMIIGPFFMFRKSLLEKAGMFDEQLKQGPDYDLAVRLALWGKAARTKKELGYYLDEGKGASTRPDSLQPIERTVIDLRYFIWDKVYPEHFEKALTYNIHQLKFDKKWENVSKYIPDYELFATNQQKYWQIGEQHSKRRRKENRINKIKYALHKIKLFKVARSVWEKIE